ncbi:AAA family ATPase [Bacterioplanes sanyensis]|uniref:AAA family ATPase n=1 Tax=Bacterioplanes sanyensis TaxID=1249553 RepID=A0A222FME3_9GAMM|nr:AAA family ATPase [Bacterioplanes sanyensis]ASP39393.1 AAA family ATPase [Bacterioplanes sanyensis]
MSQAQRLPAEIAYQNQLEALKGGDQGDKPKGWCLSPWAVKTFILGTQDPLPCGTEIEKKIFGNDALVERAIVTLISERGLLLIGEPGTAKSLLSELLAAAISGKSTHTVQGSAGLMEESIRYSFNYALLLKDGPSREALVPAPLYQAMESGQLMRFEEITRCPTETQDTLIPVLSDRILQVPELGDAPLLASAGFNVIATANIKDKGVHELSAALKRRFNFEVMQPLASCEAQSQLITREVNKRLAQQGLHVSLPTSLADLLAQVFDELRHGEVQGVRMEPISSVLSSAEAIGLGFNAVVQSQYFGEQPLSASDIAAHMVGTVIKDNDHDLQAFKDYLRLVQRHRGEDPIWRAFLAGHPG